MEDNSTSALCEKKYEAFAIIRSTMSTEKNITIVIPVYGDWSSLRLCIKSLKKHLPDQHTVLLVNDCGPEADMIEKNILTSIEGRDNFRYERNPKNLGFVKNCNRAVFELDTTGNDILLLNSDTKVTKNFYAEMQKVLYSEEKIGAVTSRSNNATVWSVPMNGRFAHHRVFSYLLYLLMKPTLPKKYITPTIHGFCVLIRRDVIDQYGLFDEIYGKGYAEENDFSLRIQEKGWKCAVANRSYVFHYESRSFGNEGRNEQIAKNHKILLGRYPDYDQRIQEYIRDTKEFKI